MPEGGSSGQFASPPCLMHEFDDEFGLEAAEDDPQQRLDVMRWRKAERDRLLALRRDLPMRLRRQHDAAILELSWPLIERLTEPVVALYWPIRGEPDLRPLARRVEAAGGRCALPVVAERNAPLVFRLWDAGTTLRPGTWGIPEPVGGSDVLPTVIVSPLLGFDDRLYRLGNGGGYYDRTLAVLKPAPLVIGVGYDMLRIPTIFPQPHDRPMDLVVTETGIREPEGM